MRRFLFKLMKTGEKFQYIDDTKKDCLPFTSGVS